MTPDDWQEGTMSRVIVWFSCGAASAVAARLAIKKSSLPVELYYTDPGGEHEDNQRFLKDCEQWLGQSVNVERSGEYSDPWDVFRRTGWLVGPAGARCTTELKKRVRHRIEQPGDIQVFGYTAEEQGRVDRFRANHPDVEIWCPLVDEGLTKADCIGLIERAGIDLPVMYRLGYRNNNCIGCVKGQAGYWNKIRKDFPHVFTRMAKIERELDAAICKTYAGDGKRKRVFLDELDPNAGRFEEEPDMSCGLFCQGLDV